MSGITKKPDAEKVVNAALQAAKNQVGPQKCKAICLVDSTQFVLFDAPEWLFDLGGANLAGWTADTVVPGTAVLWQPKIPMTEVQNADETIEGGEEQQPVEVRNIDILPD